MKLANKLSLQLIIFLLILIITLQSYNIISQQESLKESIGSLKIELAKDTMNKIDRTL